MLVSPVAPQRLNVSPTSCSPRTKCWSLQLLSEDQLLILPVTPQGMNCLVLHIGVTPYRVNFLSRTCFSEAQDMSRAAWAGIFFYLEHVFQTQNKSCLGACNIKYGENINNRTLYFFYSSNVCDTRTSGVGHTPLLTPTMWHMVKCSLCLWCKNNVEYPVKGNLRGKARDKVIFVNLDRFELYMEGSCLQQASSLVFHRRHMM